MLLLMSSRDVDVFVFEPVSVFSGEVVVDGDAAFGARDRGECDAEVVCGDLHREPVRESLWTQVVDWSDGLRVGEDSVDFPGDEALEAS